MAAVYPQKVDGTAQTWMSSTGTNVITCTSLASGSGQQGAKSGTFADGTLGNPIEYRIKLLMQFTSAPTDGKEVEVWLGQSSSGTAGTDNPGGLSGTDATYTVSRRFQLQYCGSLIASNSIGTGAQQESEFVVPRLELFLAPLIFNNADVAFDATALHTVLTITPVFWKIP